jgi:hypothetical protein
MTATSHSQSGGATPIRARLRRLLRVVLAAGIAVGVAAAAAVAAIYLTGPDGFISCVTPPASPNGAHEAIPRWVFAAGIPALVATFVGAFFALAPERVLYRLVALILVVSLVGATFYAVYSYLPASCLQGS